MTTRIPLSLLANSAALSAKSYGAVGDGATIDDTFIQAALTAMASLGGGTVFLPAGTYLLDNAIKIPAKVRLEGVSRNGTVLKAVGRDTHARNSAIFGMCNGVVGTTNNPCMISLEGDDAELCNLRVDGNGTQNYLFNAVTGVNDFLDESTTRTGICGARVGGLLPRATVGTALRKMYRAGIRDVDFFNCSWGAAQINGAVMNGVDNQVTAEASLFGCIDCYIENCHFENNHSNVLQVNGVVNFKVKNNTFVSPWHAAIKVYMRAKGGQIDGNRVYCDETRNLIWDLRDASVAAVRERELATRSEMICVGHSDYDREIRDVSVTNNQVVGNGVGIRHGITVYGRCENIHVGNNHIVGTIYGISFTFPQSLTISGNRIAAQSYTTVHQSPGTEYTGADIALWPRTAELTKTMAADTCRIDIFGNTLTGSGVSNFRVSNFDNYDANTLKPLIRFCNNMCDHTNLADLGATTKIPVGVFDTAAAGGKVFVRGNMHVSGLAEPTYASTYNITSAVSMQDTIQGTFTPTSRGSTSAGAGTYTSQSGTYTISGGRLHFELQIAWSAHTGTGDLWIEGLPFAPKAAIPTVALSVMHAGLATGAGTQLAAQVPTGETRIYLFGIATGAGATAVAVDTVVSMLRIAGSYPI